MRIATYKTHFFKEIDSPEKAWVLGWIYGDGTVQGDDVMERGIYLKRKHNILKEFMGELARPA